MYYYKNLPKVLSDEEQIAEFKKCKLGDLESRERIIVSNLRLVIMMAEHFISSYYGSSLEITKDDLIEVGEFGLIRAVDTFDITKQYKFSTYAIRCISNEILMLFRKYKNSDQNISLDAKIKESEDKGGINYDQVLLVSDEDMVLDYEEKELYLKVRDIVNTLPDKIKNIIVMHYGFNGKVYSQLEIANIVGWSQPYVSRIINQTLEKILIELKEQGLVETSNIMKVKKKTKKK